MTAINKQTGILLFFVSALTLASVFIITKFSATIAVAIIMAIIIAMLTFVSTEFALYMLIFAMLLGPQFSVGDTAGESVRGRGLTLRVDDFFLIIIGMSWFMKTAINKDLGLFLKTPLNGPIALYFVACVLSTTWGYAMGRVKGNAGFFFVLKYFEYFIVYFMAVNHLKEKKQIERFLYFMLLVCFLVCLYAIAQIPSGVRVSAPFEGKGGEPNTLGGYLVLMLSVTLGLLLSEGKVKYKPFLFALVGVIVVSLAATLSRSSWISLGPMALSFLTFSDKRKLVLAAIVISLIVIPIATPKTVKDRFLYTVTQPKEEGQIQIGATRIDTSTSARLISWKIVMTKDFLNHPLLGYGVTGYYFVDAQIPRVLAETGLIGLATFLFLLFSIYRNAVTTYRTTRDPFFKSLTIGYLAGFFALLTHAIGSNTFIIVRIMEPFWFLTAMVIMIPPIEAGIFGQTLTEDIKSGRPLQKGWRTR